MNRNQNTGSWIIWIFLIVILFGSGLSRALGSISSLLMLAFFAFVFYTLRNREFRAQLEKFFINLFAGSSSASNTRRERSYSQEWTHEHTEPNVNPQAIADAAMRSAGHMPNPWGVRFADIGILAYHGDETPDICREEAVPKSATHLRPFVVIDLPYEQGGNGTIIFDFVDKDGDIRFHSTKRYQLKHGKNFITPPTWLPLEAQREADQWKLKVGIGDKTVALHQFSLRGHVESSLKGYLKSDGEVDEFLKKAVDNHRSTGMSLDELLGDQPADQHELNADEFIQAGNQQRQSRRM